MMAIDAVGMIEVELIGDGCKRSHARTHPVEAGRYNLAGSRNGTRSLKCSDF
jgi:hypothetical protein